MQNNDECSALILFMHIKDKCMWNRFYILWLQAMRICNQRRVIFLVYGSIHVK